MSWYVPNTGVVPAGLMVASVSEGTTFWPRGLWSRGGDSSDGAGAVSGSGRTWEAGSPCCGSESTGSPGCESAPRGRSSATSTEVLSDAVAYAENSKIQS